MDSLTVSTVFHLKILECFGNKKKKKKLFKLLKIVRENAPLPSKKVAKNYLIVIILQTVIHMHGISEIVPFKWNTNTCKITH